MSSKLHRGGLPPEPIHWRSVATPDEPASIDGQPANAYVPPTAGSESSGRRFVSEPELKLQAAYQQGSQEGQAAIRQEFGTRLEAMQQRIARTIEELSGLRPRYRHEAEEDVVALALAIARRILHRELTVAPEALLGLVKAALEKIEAREVHRVRIRPEDAPMVKQFLEAMGLPQRIEVLADPGLDRGAAIFDSSRGSLDASVDTQLSEIERGLADVVKRV